MPPHRKEGCRAYSFEREDKGVYNKVNDCSPNHEKRAQDAPFFSVWRRRWDSNPRYPEVQLISSQSRYDHFDTSPFLFSILISSASFILQLFLFCLYFFYAVSFSVLQRTLLKYHNYLFLSTDYNALLPAAL